MLKYDSINLGGVKLASERLKEKKIKKKQTKMVKNLVVYFLADSQGIIYQPVLGLLNNLHLSRNWQIQKFLGFKEISSLMSNVDSRPEAVVLIENKFF